MATFRNPELQRLREPSTGLPTWEEEWCSAMIQVMMENYHDYMVSVSIGGGETPTGFALFDHSPTFSYGNSELRIPLRSVFAAFDRILKDMFHKQESYLERAVKEVGSYVQEKLNGTRQDLEKARRDLCSAYFDELNFDEDGPYALHGWPVYEVVMEHGSVFVAIDEHHDYYPNRVYCSDNVRPLLGPSVFQPPFHFLRA
ncbi:uncharacterized protein K452DRAFT_361676 [Aplosporella prunicola CBS 121167]|uniref:Uncharacterized protein n=1 Tax=Aplosporella prunicola CBS 121167 TaxID=1176127 RepID=A0A6A6B180_9PEZI|nr:uncharacterized protein K452DRAFT_361676 [Aplosporella prunicola CBS 121167]KAF2137952.1 hypothetical protein K452DRAFT_361676 [Aplosporella prunicola CBS 121167]